MESLRNVKTGAPPEKRNMEADTENIPVQGNPDEGNITKEAMRNILERKLMGSELELMRAENMQLKQTLDAFSENYRKFEETTAAAIEENRTKTLQTLTRITKEFTEKLSALQESNKLLSQGIARVMGSVEGLLVQSVGKRADEMDVKITDALVDFEAGIDKLKKKTDAFWYFGNIKAAIFWSMSIAILLLVGRPAAETFGVAVPLVVWKVGYALCLVPAVLVVGGIVMFVYELLTNR